MDVEKRIMQERENWRRDRPYGFVAKPRATSKKTLDLFVWECVIPGPKHSPFSDLELKAIVTFYKTYPLSPPGVQFMSNVYHPNVYADGVVCLDILAGAWKPSMNIKSVLLAIKDLLLRPNTDSPANEGASHLYITNRKQYDERAIVFYSEGHVCVN